ncbi:hypothetical protein MJ1HA_1403 [Metallosphaera sedula]|nr:hypothetical protein MJ1HA_1403 [Metallosphaera sedula]
MAWIRDDYNVYFPNLSALSRSKCTVMLPTHSKESLHSPLNKKLARVERLLRLSIET